MLIGAAAALATAADRARLALAEPGALANRLRAPIAAFGFDRRRHCVLCGRRVARFLPWRGGSRALPPLMRALAIVGSDVDAFECPRCGAHDRERHLMLYLKADGLFEAFAGSRILHMAPEPRLSAKIAAAGPGLYVKADLFPVKGAAARLDLLRLPFADESFDFVIANHVLEHVADDRRALGEVRRVLARGGKAILQTPFAAGLARTWEDEAVAGAAARRQAFGQEDHVRLYGRDIFERFAGAGLQPRVRAHADLLGDLDAEEAGVNPDEPLFLFEREV
ncbi:MAG TPA: methyltransferase domain-containing protein [Caulobacteraceae bacterium]|nr:methyltransferase domain-containing protein [Caulobacteraceae bacterium]